MVSKGKDPKEIERLRSNKARKRPSNASDTGSRTVKGGSGDAAVTRQQVNRQTVRPDENGKQVVQRQQVQRSSRAARKKK